MASKVSRVFAGLVALAVVGVAAVSLIAAADGTQSAGASGQTSSNIVSKAKTAVANTVLDATGVKSTAQDALISRAGDIAAATGLATSQVRSTIESLDLPSWSATELPADAQVSCTVDGTYAGVDATLTLYTDPSYVTVTAAGKSLTLAVPADAQTWLPMLACAGR